ncbi:MAG: Gfo/Idh/MocA family oxidoreductase [Proteobacteria bacterium]|nr:Gfo/Idh/MocA family oxidoreductase [Pseudomonadota bacterium]
MSGRLRVGVVGLGIGFQHLSAFRKLPELYELAAVCDPIEAKRDLAVGLLGVERGFESFDEMLASGGLDVVDVCTPPDLHRPMVTRALESGCHVISEKPLSGSLADVDAIADCERKSERRLMPIFQYRFGRGIERLRRLLEAGVAGTPYVASVETFWRRGADYYAAEWRGRYATELGGICISHAIHSHDLLQSLLGPVERVFAHVDTRVNPIETEDCAVATLRFRSGALATLTATLGSARESSRLRLSCEHLSAESSTRPYQPGSEPWTFEAMTPKDEAAIDAALRDFEPGPELYEGQFSALHRALERGEDPPVTVADARASIELVTAIYHSSRTGEPVDLPLGAEHPLYEGWVPDASDDT